MHIGKTQVIIVQVAAAKLLREIPDWEFGVPFGIIDADAVKSLYDFWAGKDPKASASIGGFVADLQDVLDQQYDVSDLLPDYPDWEELLSSSELPQR